MLMEEILFGFLDSNGYFTDLNKTKITSIIGGGFVIWPRYQMVSVKYFV